MQGDLPHKNSHGSVDGGDHVRARNRGASLFHSPDQKHTQAPNELAVGTRITDRFVLERCIGVGREGVVYEARDVVLNEAVALKCVELEPGQREAFPIRARQAHEWHRAIEDYRHVIRMERPLQIEAGLRPWLIIPMELADGGSLGSRIEGRSVLPLAQVLDWFEQACLGIEAIREAGAAHGDLHWQNLLIHRHRLKIGDLPAYRFGGGAAAAPDEDVKALQRIFAPLLELSGEQSRATEELTARCRDADTGKGFSSIASLCEAIVKIRSEQRGEVDSAVEACEAAERGDFEQALLLGRRHLDQNGDDPGLVSMLDALQRRRDAAERLYRAAEAQLEEPDLKAVLSLVGQAVDAYPGHPQGQWIQTVVQGRIQQFCEAMEAGWKALAKREWELALTHFQSALELEPRNAQLRETVVLIRRFIDRREAIRLQIDAAVQGEEYERARQLAQQVDAEAEATYRTAFEVA